MNIKALMFGALGLLVFGGLTMWWVGNDLNAIKAEERAERTKECRAAQSPASTGGATASPQRDEDFVSSCAKLGIDLEATAAPTDGSTVAGASQDPAATGGAGGAAPNSNLAPLQQESALGTENAGSTSGGGPAADTPAAAKTAAAAEKTVSSTPPPKPTATPGLPEGIGRTSSISAPDPRIDR